MVNYPRRFEIYFIRLDPTQGSEIRKTRPCLIISPDEMNRHIQTVIVAPITSTIKSYPTRISSTIENKKGQIVLDQIRTVDKNRLVSRLGSIQPSAQKKVLQVLQEMFA
jgi:mRNA interferase MazF